MVNQGDIIWLSFDPRMGTEQKGHRPALVVSNSGYHKASGNRALVCSITRTDKNLPIHVRLDERTKTQGVILSDQITTVDLEARPYKFVETAPKDLLSKVISIITLFTVIQAN